MYRGAGNGRASRRRFTLAVDRLKSPTDSRNSFGKASKLSDNEISISASSVSSDVISGKLSGSSLKSIPVHRCIANNKITTPLALENGNSSAQQPIGNDPVKYTAALKSKNKILPCSVFLGRRMSLTQELSVDKPVNKTPNSIKSVRFAPFRTVISEQQPRNYYSSNISPKPTLNGNINSIRQSVQETSASESEGSTSDCDDLRNNFSESLENWQVTLSSWEERFAFLFNNKVLSDITLVVGTQEQCIPAHKLVLTASSTVFAAMFSKNQMCSANEIDVPEFEPSAFLEFLRYLYTFDASITLDNAVQVLCVSKKYDVSSLKNVCLDFLKNNLRPENTFLLLAQARALDEPDLVTSCQEMIDRNTAEAIQEKGFLDIDLDTLCSFLKRDALNVSEIHLFEAVCRWSKKECERKGLSENPANQQAVLGGALSYIRYPLMSIEEFSSKVALSELLPEREVIRIYHYLTTNPKPSICYNSTPRRPRTPSANCNGQTHAQVYDRLSETPRVCVVIKEENVNPPSQSNQTTPSTSNPQSEKRPHTQKSIIRTTPTVPAMEGENQRPVTPSNCRVLFSATSSNEKLQSQKRPNSKKYNTRASKKSRRTGLRSAKTGNTASTLRAGKIIAKSSFETNYKCSLCTSKFLTKSHLAHHTVIHAGKTPFSCKLCPSKFRFKDKLDRHLSIHTGARPYSCLACHVKFTRSDHLKRHRDNCHFSRYTV